MDHHQTVRRQILAALPGLRAFAFTLSESRDHADDLVQETLVRAYQHIDSFQPGTNMTAWLFTILRNQLFTEYRKRRREVEDIDGSHANARTCPPHQESWIEFQELRKALANLPITHREAIVLVCGSGFTYEQAAAICRCRVGTVKSRVNRARAALVKALVRGCEEHRLPEAA